MKDLEDLANKSLAMQILDHEDQGNFSACQGSDNHFLCTYYYVHLRYVYSN